MLFRSISMVPKSQKVVVLCNNHDSGKKVRLVCKVGCTGCKLCAKKYDGFTVEDHLAHVEEGAPEASVEAALVCPSGSIIDLNTFSFEELVFDEEARTELKKLQKEHKKKLKEAKAKKKAEANKKKEAAESSQNEGKGKDAEKKGNGAKESEKDGQEKER